MQLGIPVRPPYLGREPGRNARKRAGKLSRLARAPPESNRQPTMPTMPTSPTAAPAPAFAATRFVWTLRPLTLALLLTVATLATGCTKTSGQEGAAARSTAAADSTLAQEEFRKIDVHTHYEQDPAFLVPLLKQWNIEKSMLVETIKAGPEEEPDRTRWTNMVALHQRHPERLLLCTSFDASKIEEPDFAEQTIAQLEEDIAQGAVAVKIWKNIGMIHKDASGAYLQVDDPRLQPIWDFLTEQDIPVMAHIGEPRAAWRPLDPENPHYTYYSNNPEYHNYRNSDVPSWQTIMDARDRWLEQNPELTVIGAHLGSMAYDVDEIAKRLDAYPNFYVDTAERFGDLVIQPSDKVRDFLIAYQDRVLYGTDAHGFPPLDTLSEEELEEERQTLNQTFQQHWNYLTRADSMTFVKSVASFTAETRGLDLPPEVLQKIYAQNAEQIIDVGPSE